MTFTKIAKELRELLSNPESADRLIKTSQHILQQKINDLRRVDNEIYELLLSADVSEDELIVEMESTDNYVKHFTELNFLYEETMQTRLRRGAKDEVNTARSDSSTRHSGRRKFKLPTLELKKFDGNIKNWLPFWSQFQKVHEDSEIDLSDKVQYLIQSTVVDSRARQLVDSFPATGNNYYEMIDCFRSRFGREDLQIEVYVRELLKLVIHNTSSSNKIELSLLYDKLESQLRSLDTLGITSEKYAAILFPLVESCLPSDLLRVWQRSPDSFGLTNFASQLSPATPAASTIESRLRSLMKFLKGEVDHEQYIALAAEGFALSSEASNSSARTPRSQKRFDVPARLPSATDLLNSEVIKKCVFCSNSHESAGCLKAQKLSWEQKQEILKEKGACFRCLKRGHQSRNCRMRLNCITCGKSHVPLMCRTTTDKPVGKENTVQTRKDNDAVHQTLTNGTNEHVVLQTLCVRMENAGKIRFVRALIDTGSQKTYILKSTAELMCLSTKRQIDMLHGLFGGGELSQKHACYDVLLRHANYSCSFEALDQPVICSPVACVCDGPWSEELRLLDIQISDSVTSSPIELLIGSDIAGKLYTGRRHVLQCGLVAMETLLGWTLMGKIPLKYSQSMSMTSVSLLANHASIANLWELDVLGINDPAEKQTREEAAIAAKTLFLQTINVDSDGRYEVRLPWLEGHPPLPSNLQVAKKRLDGTLKKIRGDGYFEEYDQVFKEWLNEGIIEEITETPLSKEAHYLPHRPVIKVNSVTTKVRPVFDASAKEKDSPSLNQCLEKGPNLIELIPSILLRFRRQKIGVISDIKKAFLQISLHESDRDFLRFLWTDSQGNIKVFQHRRVVFGISSSPFLLGASLEYHLTRMLQNSDLASQPFSKETVLQLLNSFYVDNCVSSVSDEKALRKFIEESSILMAQGKFDLRGWEYTNQEDNQEATTHVLGLKWNKQDDTLSLSQDDELAAICLEKEVTKRMVLSQAQRVFDPIGYTSPTTLIPKLLLQKTWKHQLPWDAPVDSEMATEFRNWIKELPHLSAIKIPRWINAGLDEDASKDFCDASKDAYAAVVFLRGIRNGQVFVRLLAAKSRVAPLKTLSIPRLELMATVIGTRLYTSVKKNLDIQVRSHFWCDSTTVLSWIKRTDEWAPFVWNRVSEIRGVSAGEDWHHVPGLLNPADLPSRGCPAKQLLQSKWWFKGRTSRQVQVGDMVLAEMDKYVWSSLKLNGVNF